MAAAAADASRSADSYIGSFISLTSKSEIRYEGVLYNINTEESSIGLRNVRAFGTEGRKKDGPQVPPSDKVYEYILFRGSDIKDLQVKSSPPTPPAPAVHSDVAIIQSHYPRPTPASTGLPFNGSRYQPDLISQTGQTAIPRAVFQGGLPLYQPPGAPGGLSSWGPSPALPTADGSGSGMPMYWQGVYAPGGHSQLPQPPVLHAHGLQMPPSMQQPLQYPGMAAPSMLPFSANMSGMEASSLSVPLNLPAENSSVPTVARPSSSLFTSSASLSSMVLPSSAPSAHATNVASEIPPPPSLNTRFAASLPETTVPASVPFISSIPKPDMDFISNKTAPIPGTNVSYQGIAHSVPASTTGLPSQEAPALVTPAQLLHGSSSISSSQLLLQSSPEEAEKKLKAVETSEEAFTESKIAVVESDGPILSITPDQKINGVSVHAAYNHHRNWGRGRGRGNELARSATKFTEDFDFNAMNEKFNKEEIWGHLGKSKGSSRERDKDQDEYGDNGLLEAPAAGSLKAGVKPVYDKNDFFDTLSCHSLDHANRFSRARMSGQQRIDFETHDRQRHYAGRGGGHGFRGDGHGFCGDQTRGSFYGRGYGHGGRDRGY